MAGRFFGQCFMPGDVPSAITFFIEGYFQLTNVNAVVCVEARAKAAAAAKVIVHFSHV